MKILERSLLILCLSFPIWGAEALSTLPGLNPGLTVSLKDRVETLAKQIYLKDIAELRGADAELLERLQNLQVGELPVFGVAKGYTKYDVIRLLRKLKIDTKKVEFEGALKTLVSQPVQKITGQQILEEAKRFVLENAPKNDTEISVTVKSQVPDLLFPEGELSYQWSVLSGENFRGSVVLGLNLIQNGEVKKTLSLSCVVRVFGSVRTASRDLQKGAILSEGDFELTNQDLTHGSVLAISEEAFVGKMLLRPLKQGAALSQEFLCAPLLIKKGKMLQLLVEEGPLKMTATGKALEDGTLGGAISAKNLDTGKVVLGRVLNSDTLLVQAKE